MKTDEQIKQNAEAYADKAAPITEQKTGIPLAIHTAAEVAYLAGAHSRDEEIKELNDKVTLHKDRADYYHDLYMKLRNPWISVEDRLPEENCVVFVSLDGTEYLSAHYRVKSKRFVTISKDKQTLVEVRKSAATYTVCGDCIKEERLYSEGEREDITAIVTHWMPIPEFKKGE